MPKTPPPLADALLGRHRTGTLSTERYVRLAAAARAGQRAAHARPTTGVRLVTR